MHCDYKKFSNQIFGEEFVKKVIWKKNVQENQFDLFQSTALNLLNKQAPAKKNIRNKQSAFVTKEIRKAIMTRSFLLNKFRKEKTEETYNKQRNFSVKLVRKV